MLNTLLAVTVALLVVLTLVVVAFLFLLILVLLMLKRTLAKASQAIDDVEQSAIIPLKALRHMFTDVEGFTTAFKAILGIISKRKAKKARVVEE